MSKVKNATDSSYEMKEEGKFKCYIRENSSDAVVFKDNLQKCPIEKHIEVNENQKWVDLGGYIGTFAMFLRSRGVVPTFSVEADPDNAEMYVKNMDLNGIKDYKLLNKAVFLNPQKPVMTLYKGSKGSRKNHAANTFFSRWKTERDTLEIPTISFDKVMKQAIKYLGKGGEWNLKLDIEGAEIDILERADLSMFNNFFFEYHFQADKSVKRAKRIFKMFRSKGYTVKTSISLPKTAEPEYWTQEVFIAWIFKS